jgi:hypothetical protein
MTYEQHATCYELGSAIESGASSMKRLVGQPLMQTCWWTSPSTGAAAVRGCFTHPSTVRYIWETTRIIIINHLQRWRSSCRKEQAQEATHGHHVTFWHANTTQCMIISIKSAVTRMLMVGTH